jgi:RimJ/RimL family protein N-acetyltransferase
MIALWRDPAVWRSLQPGMQFDPGWGEREFQHQLTHWNEHRFGLWALEGKTDGQVIGWVGPTRPVFVPELAHEVELGWTLRSEFWGRGLATEAARAALPAIFTRVSPPHVISIIHPQNHRSAGVARRLGMTHDRDVIDPSIKQRVGVWKISHSAWIKRQAQMQSATEAPAAGPR